MERVAVVTGAGSGVGRATALKLVELGWSVVLIGRTEETLRATAAAAKEPKKCTVLRLRVGDLPATKKLGEAVLAQFGHVDLLVNAAGTNVPKRSLEVLSNEDYHEMLDSNLNGAYYLIQAFLPTMRKQQSGMIVNIVSDSGRQ